ncbi:MAG: hypothetical protein LWW86_16325 [Micrococcales bacterium]|nr:hypothetical protein [Micrococcales bacterium]
MTDRYVELDQLDLARQLFDRQKSHMASIDGYISTTCHAPGAFRGLMTLLQGHYGGALTSAHTGMSSGQTIAGECSSRIVTSRDQIIADDSASATKFAQQGSGQVLGAAQERYTPPAGSDPLGGKTPDGRYPTNPAGGAWSATSGAAGDLLDELGKKASGINDPETSPNPTWWDERRAGRYNRDMYDRGQGEGLSPSGGYRTGDDYSYNSRVQSGFDQGYYRGSRWAAGQVPDGTPYEGAADRDGNITQNRRPGSAWMDPTVADNVSAPYGLYTEGKDLVDNVTGIWDEGKDLVERWEANQRVNQLADGPSNTGSLQWATNPNGGTW